jgi:HSP20 family protein
MSMFNITRKDPFAGWPTRVQHPFAGLHEEMDRMLGEFMKTPGTDQPEWFRVTHPPVDVKQNVENVTVKAELPGMGLDDIHVVHEGNFLVISGEKREERADKGDTWQRQERWSGKFERRIALPENSVGGKIEAVFDQGVLTVTIPLEVTEKTRPRRIQVKT